MGFLSAIIGAPARAKFIRSLLVRRVVGVDGVVQAGLHHSLLKRVDAMSFAEVMATPEATLVTIIESLVELSRQGVPMVTAIGRINAYRNGTVMAQAPPGALDDLRSFLVFRVLAEHGTRAPGITPQWFDEFVPEVFERYGVRTNFDTAPALRTKRVPPPVASLPPAIEVEPPTHRYLLSCPDCLAVMSAEFGAKPRILLCPRCAHEFMSNEAFGVRRL